MLINLLTSGDRGSKQFADLVAPTTDVDTTVRQVFPNFPYTETPILPPEVYRKGLSSREKVQELPGMDPIFVVKTPTWFRSRPSDVKLPAHCLRSTWILVPTPPCAVLLVTSELWTETSKLWTKTIFHQKLLSK